MGISERIRLVAESKAKNLKDFSLLVGIPYRTIQNYVGGQREPRQDLVTKICTRTGVSIHWMLTGEGSMFEAAQDAPDASAECDQIPDALAGQKRRIAALLGVLEALDPEGREAVLSECITRAEAAQQLAELKLAVQELEAKARTG